jgi:hypothetical protein
MNRRLLNLVAATCVAVATATSASAKAKPSKTTLADFKGNYTGTISLTLPGVAFTGPVSLGFNSNKKGTTGSISVSGSTSYMGTTLPVAGSITLAKGAFSIDSFLFNTLTQMPLPASATYTVGKNTITYQGTANAGSDAYPYSGTIQTKTKGRTQTLTYTATLDVSGTPYVYTFTVSRKLKKSEIGN